MQNIHNISNLSINLNSGESNIEKDEIKEFMDNFFGSQSISELDLDNNDSYSLLLFVFILWIKQNESKINIVSHLRGHFKIKIDKTIGYEQLRLFSLLFEELTLKRINFLDNDIKNEWFCDLRF